MVEPAKIGRHHRANVCVDDGFARVLVRSYSRISGSTWLDDFVVIGGQGALAGHLHLGKGAQVAGKSGVMRDVGPGETVGGSPAVPVRDWHRQTAALSRLIGKKKT